MTGPNINYSSIRFSVIEVIAILNVLKHSRDFGQGSAPEGIVSDVISKIEMEENQRNQNPEYLFTRGVTIKRNEV